jgi:hypothetical protein
MVARPCRLRTLPNSRVSAHFEIDNHFQFEHNQGADGSRLRRAEE